ncbi:MAG: tRNA pseudouridine(38-40) synthase TruA [bacterium]|nr:tRNA pseudouridine(38-40) synthase TruA [bacterium]
MANYKLSIQYEGTRYNGWQRQDSTDMTIQGKIEQVLSRLYEEKVEIDGSGRTDGGVHALEQIANFKVPKAKNRFLEEEILSYLNEYLPLDIRVHSMEQVDERFHARLSAKSKIYEYHIDRGKVENVFHRRFAARTGEPVDVERMKAAAAYCLGTHDFKSFCSNKKMKKSTVRTIHAISFREENDILTIRFRGDGFLYNMVRILVGTLVEIGDGRREPEEMKQILEAKDRGAAGYTAPPQGLFLVKVFY